MMLWALIAAVGLAAVAALGFGLWSRLQLGRLQRVLSLQETELLSLRGAISAVGSSGMDLDERLEAMEKRLLQVTEQQAQLALRDAEQGPFRHAMRLADRGASAEELMDSCGLTRGEADLLLSLRRTAGDSEA